MRIADGLRTDSGLAEQRFGIEVMLLDQPPDDLGDGGEIRVLQGRDDRGYAGGASLASACGADPCRRSGHIRWNGKGGPDSGAACYLSVRRRR